LCRAIFLLEPHHLAVRERGREGEDALAASGTEAVDRLHVVTDHAHADALAVEGGDDLDLQRVHVLVLSDEDVVERRGDRRRKRRPPHRRLPVQEQGRRSRAAATRACAP
jgi:hypothetical protein